MSLLFCLSSRPTYYSCLHSWRKEHEEHGFSFYQSSSSEQSSSFGLTDNSDYEDGLSSIMNHRHQQREKQLGGFILVHSVLDSMDR